MGNGTPGFLFNTRLDGEPVLLAHGEGTGMHHFTMEPLALEIASHALSAGRFVFSYMADGRTRPDPEAVLMETWRAVIAIHLETEKKCSSTGYWIPDDNHSYTSHKLSGVSIEENLRMTSYNRSELPEPTLMTIEVGA